MGDAVTNVWRQEAPLAMCRRVVVTFVVFVGLWHATASGAAADDSTPTPEPPEASSAVEPVEEVTTDVAVADPVTAETPARAAAVTEPIATEVTAAEPVAIERTAQATTASEPVTVSWGRGVTFRSDDGLVSLQVRGRVQAQALVESADGADGARADLLVRRARLAFRGHLLSEHLEYYVQLGLAPRDMEPDLLIPLRDASLAWTGLREMNVRVGVMKVPFSRERVISSASLQLVDRSIANAELALDRDNGVQLSSTDLFGLGGYLGYQLGVYGGDGRLRVNGDLGLLWVARVQVQPLGTFEDSYIESDQTREQRARLSIGAGFAYNEDTPRRRRTTTDFYRFARFSYFHAELDAIFKYAGFSVQAEVLLRHVDGPETLAQLDAQGALVTESAGSALGWFVQAGYLFGFAPIELAARYADVLPLGPQSTVRRSREVTLGLNWYVMGHDLKLQLDGSYLSHEPTGGVAAPLEERFQARLQVQAHF